MCISSPDEAGDGKLYFVKHRHGAQGKTVHVLDRNELHLWFSAIKNTQDFVIYSRGSFACLGFAVIICFFTREGPRSCKLSCTRISFAYHMPFLTIVAPDRTQEKSSVTFASAVGGRASSYEISLFPAVWIRVVSWRCTTTFRLSLRKVKRTI